MTCRVILLPMCSAIDPDDYEPRKLARDLSRDHIPAVAKAETIRHCLTRGVYVVHGHHDAIQFIDPFAGPRAPD